VHTFCDFFFFNVKSIDTEKRVSLSFKEEELERALKRIVGDRYQYELSGNLIIVTESKLGTPTTPQAQKRKITGTVKDKKGEPLPGVNVLVKGTSVGVATDINGKFIIESPVVKSPVLVFSFVGMLNKEVTVSSDAPLNVVLEDEEKVLDDVIVTGYRSISKTTFTGSSTKLQQDDIKLKGVMHVSRMIFSAGMNLRAEGGGVPMAPDAVPDDGMLCLAMAHDVPKWLTFFLLPFLVAGKQKYISVFDCIPFKECTLHLSSPMTVHADGEYCGENTTITYKCLPGKLHFLKIS